MDGTLVVIPVACAVPGRAPGDPKLSGTLPVHLRPGSLAHRIYGRTPIAEEYFCNFDASPALQARLTEGGLSIAGTAEDGTVRIVERPGHPFFLATAFLPQLSSAPGKPHPVIVAYLRAANRC